MLRPGIFGADLFFEYTISAFEIHSFTPFWQGLKLLIGFLDSGCFRPNSFLLVLLFRFPFFQMHLTRTVLTNGQQTVSTHDVLKNLLLKFTVTDSERVVTEHIVLQTNS